MRSIILAAVLLVSTTALPADKPLYEQVGDKYDFDKAPVSELKAIMECLTDRGQCSPAGKSFRQLYPKVMENACEMCTEKQKCIGYIFYDRIAKELPQELDELKSKFDPEGKYFGPFFATLEKSHFEQHPHGH